MYTTHTRHQTSHASTICSTRQAGTWGASDVKKGVARAELLLKTMSRIKDISWARDVSSQNFESVLKCPATHAPSKKQHDSNDSDPNSWRPQWFMRPTISVVPVTHDLCSLVEMDDILLKATWHSEEAGGQRTRFQTYFYWGMRHDTLTC